MGELRMRTNHEAPKSIIVYFINHLRRFSYPLSFSKLILITGEYSYFDNISKKLNTYLLEPRETVSFVAPRACC